MRYSFKLRQAIFTLINQYDKMAEKGRVRFPTERTYNDLIDYFEQECLLERALEVTEHAITQFGSTSGFIHRKAELFLENQEPAKALSTLDFADRLRGNCLRSSILRAEGLASLELYEDAVALLDGLKPGASGEELCEILVSEAQIYEQLKEYERMFYVLKAALQECPTNIAALTRMWYCVEYARKYEESLELHERILDEDPFCSMAWYNLGAAHHYLCNHEDAIDSYEYAFLTKEDFEFAYRDCAEVCLSIRDFRKALQCYQEMLERFEPDAVLFVNVGTCYMELRNFHAARSFFEQATHFDACNAEAWHGLGQSLCKLNEWHKAIEAFRKAILMEDFNEDYHSAIADAYRHVGNRKKAEAHYREAAELAPELGDHWSRLVNFLLDQNRTEEALLELESAEEDCFDAQLIYLRSQCLFTLERKSEALKALKEGLNEDFEGHSLLLERMPSLKDDREVSAIIRTLMP